MTPHRTRTMDDRDGAFNTILDFLGSLGLAPEIVCLEEATFLPGIKIVEGRLTFDPDRLMHPGDLLHEAGHIAVVPSEERPGLTGNIDRGPGDEMAAIAWSWAALTHLGLAPEVVFHEDGYHGASPSIIVAFRRGGSLGVPLLQWMGLTTAFPKMERWLRE